MRTYKFSFVNLLVRYSPGLPDLFLRACAVSQARLQRLAPSTFRHRSVAVAATVSLKGYKLHN